MSLAKEILAQWKTLAKGARLSPREKVLLSEVATDAAALQVQIFTGAVTDAKAKREKAQLDAQIASIKSIGGGRANKLFWQAAEEAALVLVKVLVAV